MERVTLCKLPDVDRLWDPNSTQKTKPLVLRGRVKTFTDFVSKCCIFIPKTDFDLPWCLQLRFMFLRPLPRAGKKI